MCKTDTMMYRKKDTQKLENKYHIGCCEIIYYHTSLPLFIVASYLSYCLAYNSGNILITMCVFVLYICLALFMILEWIIIDERVIFLEANIRDRLTC